MAAARSWSPARRTQVRRIRARTPAVRYETYRARACRKSRRAKGTGKTSAYPSGSDANGRDDPKKPGRQTLV